MRQIDVVAKIIEMPEHIIDLFIPSIVSEISKV